MKNPTVALLMPALNEIEGLKLMLPRIDRSLFSEIIILDGGSTDGTVEYAKKNNVKVINQVHSNLSLATYYNILELKSDYVIEFSPDNNCIPEQLPDMIAKMREGYDVVVVSRYLPPAKSADDNLVTAFGNWMFSKMIRFLGKFPVTDGLNMYRGFRCNIMTEYDFKPHVIPFVFEPLVSAMANLYGMKYCEIPGDEPKRIGGVSKMSVIGNGSCILYMIIRLYIKKFTMIFSRKKRN